MKVPECIFVEPCFPEFGGIVSEAGEALEEVRRNCLGRVGEGGLELASKSLIEVMSENVRIESLLLIISLEM